MGVSTSPRPFFDREEGTLPPSWNKKENRNVAAAVTQGTSHWIALDLLEREAMEQRLGTL